MAIPRTIRRDVRGTRIGGKPLTQKGWQQGQLARALSVIPGTKIGGKQLTVQGWQRGDLLRALTGGRPFSPTTGVAPAPAPAPQAPAAAPLDPAYLARMEALARAQTQGYADVGGERQRGLLGYGYTEGPTGALTFNPNDPFSKASLLKRNYDQSRARAAQQMGSGGQLYAGAFQTQQDVVNRGQLQAEDALQRSLQDFLARNTARRAQVGTDYELGAAQAESERTGRIETNPLYEPTASPADVQTAKTGNTVGPVVTNRLGHKGRWITRPNGTKYFQRT